MKSSSRSQNQLQQRKLAAFREDLLKKAKIQ
jgi:hypothetical protein